MDAWTHNNILRLEKQKLTLFLDNNQLHPFIDHSTFESALTKNKKESSFELDPVHNCINKFVQVFKCKISEDQNLQQLDNALQLSKF